jgi:predicted O-methyltransferase YrrM
MSNEIEFLGDIVEHPDPYKDPLLSSNNYYRHYYGLSRLIEPRVIAEIGVLYGYSAYSMIKGSGVAEQVYLIDNDSYVRGSLERAWEKLERKFPHVAINAIMMNTRLYEGIGEAGAVDLFHVDGDHSYNGCAHDLELARKSVRKGGIILIDDIDFYETVKRAADDWCERYGYEPWYIKTYRGLYVVKMRGS